MWAPKPRLLFFRPVFVHRRSISVARADLFSHMVFRPKNDGESREGLEDGRERATSKIFRGREGFFFEVRALMRHAEQWRGGVRSPGEFGEVAISRGTPAPEYFPRSSR